MPKRCGRIAPFSEGCWRPSSIRNCGGRLAGVEVKAGSTVTTDDFKGLHKLQDASPNAFAAGVVLYDGEAVVSFGNNLHAVPISSLWGGI